MRQFVIKPLVSVGDIEFGMDRREAREILGECEEYRNRPEDVNTADSFDICQVFYSESDKVEFIMFHELDGIELRWGDQMLNEMTKDELFSFFTPLDESLSVEDDVEGDMVSFESNALGVACYFVKDIDYDEDDNEIEFEKVETISFAVENFWA
ncbi:MAG: hypothetical protein FWG42_04620 [Clostridiales bacterium]|nr:hypothetical protein [Clostridiales bacterium]